MVAQGSGAGAAPINITVPNAKLWSPDTPFLYTANVTACYNAVCDSVGTYFGLRTVSLGQYQKPATPPTGPQAGIDRGGSDLPGSPFNLPSADPNLCWAACNKTADCTAWAYGVPSCGGDPAQVRYLLPSYYCRRLLLSVKLTDRSACPLVIARTSENTPLMCSTTVAGPVLAEERSPWHLQ